MRNDTLNERMRGLLRLVLVIFECQTLAVLSLDVEKSRSFVTSILCILEVWPLYVNIHLVEVRSHFLMVASADPVNTYVSNTAAHVM